MHITFRLRNTSFQTKEHCSRSTLLFGGATRYFAFGEYSLALRLTSELVDLRAANANRIPLRFACGAESVSCVARPKQKRYAMRHPVFRLRRIFARSPPDKRACRSPSGECEPDSAALRLRSRVRFVRSTTKTKTVRDAYRFCFGGATRNRTGDKGFADPCLTA